MTRHRMLKWELKIRNFKPVFCELILLQKIGEYSCELGMCTLQFSKMQELEITERAQVQASELS